MNPSCPKDTNENDYGMRAPYGPENKIIIV